MAKSRLAERTMNGPVGSRVPRNERNAPLRLDTIPRQALQTSTRWKRSVSSDAVAAGMISMAETSTTPTACRAETTAKARSITNNRSNQTVGSASTRAKPGSKLTNRNSLYPATRSSTTTSATDPITRMSPGPRAAA